MKILETERLILRTWTEDDIEQYFNINQDPKVTEFLLGAPTLEECESFIEDQNKHFDEYKYTLFALEIKESRALIGFVGLKYRGLEFAVHFSPSTEIGWRLSSKYWGHGYATEAAKACLDYGFNECGLKEIVSFTVPANKKSISVMQRLGMKQDMNGHFRHPLLPHGHRLSEHILYRILKP